MRILERLGYVGMGILLTFAAVVFLLEVGMLVFTIYARVLDPHCTAHTFASRETCVKIDVFGTHSKDGGGNGGASTTLGLM